MVAGFDDPRLRYVRWEANAGIVGNFTRSLLGASSEFVIQLGDDDIAAPTLVARTVSALEAFPGAGVAHSRFSLIDDDGAVLMASQDWLGTPSPALEPGAVFVERSMAHGCRVCSSTALIRRSAVPEGGFLQEDAPPFDFAFWMRMAERWDVAFVDEVLCQYRIHGQSFTSGLSDVTGTGYLQVEKTLREVHAVKRRHAALCRGAAAGGAGARGGSRAAPGHHLARARAHAARPAVRRHGPRAGRRRAARARDPARAARVEAARGQRRRAADGRDGYSVVRRTWKASA